MTEMLNKPFSVGGYTLQNRVVLQPMEGCDCETDGSPSELTREKYRRAAASGAGLIWFEANAVCPEGRTNPRQMMLTAENLPQFRALLEELRGIAQESCGITPVFLLQLTHSGRQSIRPMVAVRHALYEQRRPVGDDAIVSDEYLDSLPQRYAASTKLAIEAGFDGVDVKSCHGYLLQELLAAYDRPGRYGGSFANRAKAYLDCVRAAREVLPQGKLLTSRLSVSDVIAKPYGFGTDEAGALDFAEPDLLIEALMEAGVQMLNVTLGNPYFNPHINRPYRKGGYEPPEAPEAGLARFAEVERHIKERFPQLAVVGSGLSYCRDDLLTRSEALLRDGVCDLVGYGRLWLAYPQFYRDAQSGSFAPAKCCMACSKCTELMRGGRVSGCAVFHPYYRELYREMTK